MKQRSAPQNSIRSVGRALDLLQALAGQTDWTGVRDLARMTGLKAATAHNLLKTLQARRFVEFSERLRRYRIGISAILLVQNTPTLRGMAEFAQPFVDELFGTFGETVLVLALLDGRAVTVTARESEEPLAATHVKRVIEHPHCLATGRVLLASQDEASQRAYAARESLGKLGPNLPATREDLLRELARVRSQGYAVVSNARGLGVGAVAAPVFDAGGRVAMAIGISAPLVRFGARRRRDVLEKLRAVARRMTASLGGTAGIRPLTTKPGAPGGQR